MSKLRDILYKHLDYYIKGVYHDDPSVYTFTTDQAEATIKQLVDKDVIGTMELRGDIDDKLLEYLPDMHERSLEVTGGPSSFTNLYTRGVIRDTQQVQSKRLEEL